MAPSGPQAAALRAALFAALLAAGCAEVERVPEAPYPPAQTVQEGGLALTARRDTWRGFPPDLERYYIPIEVVVENTRAAAVALGLADFTLVDRSGRERAAVTPQEATAALFGTYGRPSAIEPPAGAVAPAATFFYFSGRFGYPYYYGPYYYPYYPYPYYYGYAPYRYRSYTELTGDLLRFGLANGTLEPKASLRGFLYFARGEGDVAGLNLRWSAPGLATPLAAPVAGSD